MNSKVKKIGVNGMKKEGTCNLREPRRGYTYWTKEDVLKEIRKRYVEGKSLKYKDVKKEISSLTNIAYKYYGTWKEAVEDADVCYEINKKSRGYWTKETILDVIEERKNKGKSLKVEDVKREEGSGLVNAVYRYWSGWKDLMEMGEKR